MYTQIVVFDRNEDGGYRIKETAKVPGTEGEKQLALWLPTKGLAHPWEAVELAQAVARGMAAEGRPA